MSGIHGTTSSSTSYLRDLQQDLEEEIQRARKSVDEEQDASDRKLSRQKQRFERDLTETVKDIRENHEESVIRERENHRSEISRLRRENYDRTGRRYADETRQRALLSEQLESAEAMADARAAKSEKFSDERVHRALLASQEREQKDAQTLRDAHARETGELRDQVHAALELERRYSADRADGRQEGYREVEDEFLDQRRILEQQFQSELNSQKQKSSGREEELRAKHAEVMREHEQTHTDRIRRQEAEHMLNRRELGDAYDENIDQITKRTEGTEARFHDKLAYQRESQARAYDRTVRNQARHYEEQLARSRTAGRESAEQLEAELLEARTMPDPRRIAPVAYQKIQDAARTQADEIIKTRETQHAETLRAAKERARQTYEDQNHQHAYEVSRLNREKTRNELMAQTRVNRVASEAEERVQSIRVDKEREMTRTLGSNNRIHSREMELTRRNYEEIVANLRNEHEDKLLLIRDQMEFENRMLRRASANRENELTRDYEKRLDETKADSSEQLKRAQADAENRVRELEERQRDELNRMTAIHDRRVAQLEQQFENRERMMARNYQDEIEKLKRANAHLLAKKS